jgi:ATP-dependent Clp endopeptidase proteolytic subunit ClpP
MANIKSILTDITYFQEYDVHIPTRTIYMGSVGVDYEGESGTDSFMAERIIKNLHILDNTKDNDKPITIIMNNPGGDWYHGKSISDAIETCKNYITIVAYGYCMSMGSVIMQAADERIMAPNARMMIHYGENGYIGHSLNLDRASEENQRINEEMINIYLDKIREKNPKFTRKKLKEMLNFDTFLSAEEAKNLGLCDKILEPKYK